MEPSLRATRILKRTSILSLDWPLSLTKEARIYSGEKKISLYKSFLYNRYQRYEEQADTILALKVKTSRSITTKIKTSDDSLLWKDTGDMYNKHMFTNARFSQ